MPEFDLRELAVAQSARITLRDPRSGKPLKFEDGREVFIEISSPDSERTLRAHYDNADRLAKLDDVTDKAKRAGEIWKMAQCTHTWNIVLDGQALPCTAADAEKLYSDPMFGFIFPQLQAAQQWRANFMKPLPQISGDTPNTDERPAGATS